MNEKERKEFEEKFGALEFAIKPEGVYGRDAREDIINYITSRYLSKESVREAINKLHQKYAEPLNENTGQVERIMIGMQIGVLNELSLTLNLTKEDI